jgi:hypothetical protein
LLSFSRSISENTNTAITIGADTKRPLLDLSPDQFLDLRQVGVGFKVTLVSIVSRASHRFFQLTTGKRASTEAYASIGSIGFEASFEKRGVGFRKLARQNESRRTDENVFSTELKRRHPGPIPHQAVGRKRAGRGITPDIFNAGLAISGQQSDALSSPRKKIQKIVYLYIAQYFTTNFCAEIRVGALTKSAIHRIL